MILTEAKSNVGRKWTVEVPDHWTELRSIKLNLSALGFSAGPDLVSFDLAPFLKKEAQAIFPSADDAPSEISRGKITAGGSFTEWLLERLGYTFTIRLRFGSMMKVDMRDGVASIDDDALMVFHDRHVAVKCRSLDTRTMVAIKYGDIVVGEHGTATIAELNQ